MHACVIDRCLRGTCAETCCVRGGHGTNVRMMQVQLKLRALFGGPVRCAWPSTPCINPVKPGIPAIPGIQRAQHDVLQLTSSSEVGRLPPRLARFAAGSLAFFTGLDGAAAASSSSSSESRTAPVRLGAGARKARSSPSPSLSGAELAARESLASLGMRVA